MKRHSLLQTRYLTPEQAERERMSRLREAELRLNDAVQRLEDLVQIRRQLDRDPLVAVPRPYCG